MTCDLTRMAMLATTLALQPVVFAAADRSFTPQAAGAQTGAASEAYKAPEDGGPRGYVAAEFIKPAVSPDGSVSMGPDDSACRAGQGEFDAKGQVPCAQSTGQPMTQCDFAVARAGGGYATVVITRPDGRTRAIFFRRGVAIGADTSQADNPGAFSARRESDLTFISIGPERYEIPDAVVLGGWLPLTSVQRIPRSVTLPAAVESLPVAVVRRGRVCRDHRRRVMLCPCAVRGRLDRPRGGG